MEVDLNKIRQLRRKNNLNIADLSRSLEYKSHNGYFSLESGRTAMKASHVKKLAQIFNVPVQDLYVGGTGSTAGNITKLNDQKLLAVFRVLKHRSGESEENVLPLLVAELKKRGLFEEAMKAGKNGK